MKTASQSVGKWASRTGAAAQDYVAGAEETSKDQAALAIAAEPVYQQGLTESFARKAFSNGLRRSGKQGWLNGVKEKGGQNFSTGVGAVSAQQKYAQNSGKYDQARQAADKLPRGPRGSQTNIARVTAVALAQRNVKVGK